MFGMTIGGYRNISNSGDNVTHPETATSTSMEHISISKHTFDTPNESLEDLRKVLNKVDYDKDSTDPKTLNTAKHTL